MTKDKTNIEEIKLRYILNDFFQDIDTEATIEADVANAIVDVHLKKLKDQVQAECESIADWATGNDTGVSSQAIARYMLGLKPNEWGFSAPSDKSDRGRCIRLLNLFPEWWDRLDEMKQFRGWEKQIPLIKKEQQDGKDNLN